MPCLTSIACRHPSWCSREISSSFLGSNGSPTVTSVDSHERSQLIRGTLVVVYEFAIGQNHLFLESHEIAARRCIDCGCFVNQIVVEILQEE